ncbi:MAG: glycosyltransferase [Eubacterium sp.]|nr:glycosyltransferase [Eubacterium sp.]
MKKKLIFVIPTLRMGGAEKSLVTLLKALDSQKVEVDLFLFETGGVLQSEVPKWVNIVGADEVSQAMLLEWRYYAKNLFLKGHFIKGFVRTWISIRHKLSRKKIFEWKLLSKHIKKLEKNYDVAIGYLEGNTDFFVIDKIEAKKKIGWIHIDFSGRELLEEELEYYKKFDELATISDICRDAFLHYLPEVKNKMHIIENIVLEEDVEKKSRESVNDCWKENASWNFVSVGRLDHQKGFDIAVRAAKILVDKNISFCWHIFGEGVMRGELENFIADNKLENNIVLEGIRQNPYPYMKKADLIVQPSRYEGKSIVLDEAKILGKAIVVTEYPSVFDQIKDGETGVITKIDAKGIAEGIEKIINDTELKEYLEKNTKEEPNNSYKMIKAFYNLL